MRKSLARLVLFVSLLSAAMLVGMVHAVAEVAAPAAPCDGPPDYEQGVQCLDATAQVRVSGGSVMGALYIAGGGDIVRRQQAAPPGCPGCVWTVAYICDVRVSSDSQGECNGGSNLCANARQLVHVELTIDGKPDNSYDYCPTTRAPPRPVALAAVVATLRDKAQQSAHAAAPAVRYQPRDGAITQLPTYFAVDEAGRTPTSFTVAVAAAPEIALDVTVTPTAWTWDFGDGGRPLMTSDPGGDYPDGNVTHTYTRRGPVTVTTATTSAVTHLVRTPYGDLPGEPAAQPAISLPTKTVLRVREARAVLTG